MIYYALDENDITNVVYEGTREGLMEKFNINSDGVFDARFQYNKPINGIYIVSSFDGNPEKEGERRYDKIFDDLLIHETKRKRYYVNRHGYIYSVDTKTEEKHILSSHATATGHLFVRFGQKTRSVAKLVASAFVEGRQEGSYVYHVDGDLTNNDYTNLKWMPGYKGRKGTRVGLFVDGKCIREFVSEAHAGRELYCTKTMVRRYAEGLTQDKNKVYDIRKL